MSRILLAVFLLCLGLRAQTPSEALRTLLATPDLQTARVGVLVRDLANGQELCLNDDRKGFMTASNMKLVSSSTALVTLGPDFRFETTLIGTVPIQDGVLSGDLILVGSGDPTLGGRQEGSNPAAVFERLVDTLIRDHGLKQITGNIVGDDNCQPDEIMGEGWAWGYQGDAYAAQVSGLCFAENIAAAYFESDKPGLPAKLHIVPKTTFIHPINKVLSHKLVTSLWSRRKRGTNQVTFGGKLAPRKRPFRERFSVENPTAYAAHMLWETLIAKGVQVNGQPIDRDDLRKLPDRYGDETPLATHSSAPLSEILNTLNKVSQNLYAEQLIRAASRQANGQASMRNASAHAKKTLAKLGVDVRGMRIADGSGLSRLDLVQPRQLADLLTGMWGHKHRELFVSTLPIAGIDGTLSRRFRDGKAKGHVFAKTGYISSVVALSGYVSRPDAKAPPLVFSILVNNFTCQTATAKAAVDSFVNALAHHTGW